MTSQTSNSQTLRSCHLLQLRFLTQAFGIASSSQHLPTTQSALHKEKSYH